jgi:hypothetical protein
MRLVFRRELTGWQDEQGRWRILESDVERVAASVPATQLPA